jgi:hypothetical protein
MKLCYKCGSEKGEKSEIEFYEDKNSHDGLTAACIDCLKEISKANYDSKKNSLTEEQKRKRKAAYDKWKAANPEKYKKNYAESNKNRKIRNT